VDGRTVSAARVLPLRDLSNDFDKIVRALGGSHFLAGSKVDCRTMAFGTWAQVQAEIDATLALTRGLPGYMFAVGNHIPANVTDERCLQFMEYLRHRWGHA
jgi:uroporphyrinogen-III decarboxylase